MTDRTFAAGETIYRAGDVGDMAYVIKSGRARVTVEANGADISIDLGVGDFLGDGPLLLSSGDADQRVSPYRATAVAIDDVTAIEVPHDLLRAEIHTASPFLRGWITSFADRALQVVEAALAQAKR